MARHGRAGDDGERSPAAQRASTVTGGSETRPPASASADPFAHVPLDDGQRRRTARRAHRGRVLDSPSRVEGWLGGIEPAAAPVNVEDPWDHEQHAGHEKPRKPEDPPGDVPDDRNPDPQPQPQPQRPRALGLGLGLGIGIPVVGHVAGWVLGLPGLLVSRVLFMVPRVLDVDGGRSRFDSPEPPLDPAR